MFDRLQRRNNSHGLTWKTSKDDAIWIGLTYTRAVVESITTIDEWSLNAVVKKHPNVRAANTVSVNANMVFALAKKVFILRIFEKITSTR